MPSTKNATLATVAGALALAEAESVTVALPVRLALAAGAVIETDSPEAATVTLTAVEVTTAPFESVTRAVSEAAPVAVGVHVTELLDPEAGVLTVFTRVVPAKNSTLASVAAPTELAVAVSVTGVFTVTVDPAVGAVSATLGAVTLTLTIVDVTTVPLESVTLAVSAVIPEADGVQLT